MSSRLRSVLYMPGANARALEKAKSLPADALIFDLEDAVAPAVKAAAREQVCDAARSGDYPGRVVTIRVNGLGTEWHVADLAAAAAAAPAAVLVPKVDCVEDVRRLEQSLSDGGAPDSTALWAMLETPRAILHAEAIAAASERLTVLVMGTNDLANELHTVSDPARTALLPSLSWCVLAARATGKSIVDGVFNDVRDPEGFAAECRAGVVLGFDGKTLIHPNQVEPCNAAFSPSAAEIEQAHRVIAAFEAAQAAGAGVATVDGRMIENLHVANATRILQLADERDIV